jgi:hypothetical protein
MSGFIRAQKFSAKQQKSRDRERKDKLEKDCAYAIGFRKVIDLISESDKIIVGHNMLLDVCHMVGQFVEPLPDSLDQFKETTHRIFPK